MVAVVPWGHHANALAKLSAPAARLYYLRATAQFGWSRNVLLNQIKAKAYERAVIGVDNLFTFDVELNKLSQQT